MSTPSDPRPRASSLSRRPTTPLRRISASSLKSLSLSHSRSRLPNTLEPPLHHLSHIFAELADAVSDLAGNLEALDGINERLDGFNESFAGYLYGLRINAYTADFDEAPTALNFALASQRAPPSPPPFLANNNPREENSLSPPASPSQGGNETTFVTNDEDLSFKQTTPRAGAGTGGRGRGGTTLRGGTRGRGRGGAGGNAAVTRKKKEEIAAFADSIIQSLPIKFREEQPQRGETEKVIGVLREFPNGLAMAEFTKQITVPNHRINDALTALVRAKFVLKVFAQGVTTYRFDQNKVSL